MTELIVNGVRESGKEPNYKRTAAELLKRCREFYQDPANVRALEEWKAGKGVDHEKVDGLGA